MEKLVQFCGQPMRVACDERCTKAWGIQNRPRDAAGNFLPDDDLGFAPSNPGTYEDADGKPGPGDTIPNKWCVRQCERCYESAMGQSALPPILPDFSRHD